MFTSKDRISQMQPSCLILEDVDEPRSGFDGGFNGKPTGQVSSSQANVYSSLLSGLDAPYLSISPMLALGDSFETRSVDDDDDEAIDLNLDGNFHYSSSRHQHHQLAPTTFPSVIDSDIQDCLSTDQCNSFDQMNCNNNNNNRWNELDHVPEFLKYAADSIIDDDLFINPKGGSCADPTLAELNANSKCIFDDLPVLDDLPLSEECSQFKFPTLPTTPQDSQDALVLPAVTAGCNTTMQSVPIGQTQFLPNLGLVKVETAESPLRRSTLHELLLQDNCPINSNNCTNNINNNNNSGSNNSSPSVVVVKEERIQSPQPPTNSLPPVSSVPNYAEENLYRSELTVPCTKRRQRTSTISSTSSACDSHPGTSLHDMSQGFENECKREIGSERRDSESNYDFSDSDGDDSIQSIDQSDDDRIYEVNRPRTRHFTAQDSKPKRRNKRGRYFWQYNLQAKGPKGNRLPLATESSNPHKLEQVTDPVFSPRCIIKGIKHTGKARKGDGNDLTPNPEKLHQIGQSLKSLSQTINDLTPVNELPVNVRPKSRKEKNKLASRVCRLKKKAQHEANKLKLYGLQQEHGHLIHILKEMKRQYKEEGHKKARELFQRCKEMENQMLKVRVAGRTVEFVNDVLDKVAVGVPQGGLDDL